MTDKLCDALKALDDRLRACSAIPASAADAYDSYYQEMVRAALAEAQAEPVDPMDTPLPCDVKVGNGTHRKGTRLGSLVARMNALHEAAFGLEPTPEDAARNLAILQGAEPGPVEVREALNKQKV